MSFMNVFGSITLVCTKQTLIVPHVYEKKTKIKNYYSNDPSIAVDCVYDWKIRPL